MQASAQCETGAERLRPRAAMEGGALSEQLLWERARADSVEEAAGIGLWELDLATLTIRWSAQTRRLHEAPPGYEPTYDAAMRCFPPAERVKLVEAIERAVRTGAAWDLDLPFVTLKGRALRVRSLGRPGPKRGKLIGLLQDVTEQLEERAARTRAEQALEEARAQLAGFFEVAIDLLCVIDPQGRLLKVNRALEGALGVGLGALEGTSFVDLVHPEEAAAALQDIEALERGAATINFISRCRRSDGVYRNFEWRLVRFNGLTFAAAQDITDRLAFEAELTASRDRAESAAAAKSTFLANMSHEIRTPLNGVIGLAGALAETPLNARQSEMVALIQASGETLVRLLSDILDASKIEAGKLDLEIGAFDLREAIETAAQVMRVRADDKGLDFAIHYGAAAKGLFQGDVVRVRQIVSNLVSNAIKFTERGSVHVQVEVADSGESSIVTVSVVDTGIGFDEAAAQKLFSRFEQADTSITRTFGGTGLGLAICRALCDMMGGYIHARSTPGQGSCFTVTLPLDRTMPLADYERQTRDPKTPPAAALEPARIGPLRILLAEDHLVNQRVIALILEPMGVELAVAKNGQEALDLFTGGRFDLVLMDMQMPVMDGLEATRRIRERERATAALRTPIIMLSANAMAEHSDQAIEVGCDAHVAKPVTPHALVRAIELALSMSDSIPARAVA